jgi:hypothetical protein
MMIIPEIQKFNNWSDLVQYRYWMDKLHDAQVAITSKTLFSTGNHQGCGSGSTSIPTLILIKNFISIWIRYGIESTTSLNLDHTDLVPVAKAWIPKEWQVDPLKLGINLVLTY